MGIGAGGDKLVVGEAPATGTCVLRPQGLLDSSTYHRLRDAVITAAVEQPNGVVVDVSSLSVPTASAWAVFSSAGWHIRCWPDTPLALVCHDRKCIAALRNCGVCRHVPVYTSTLDAVAALRTQRSDVARRRARVDLLRGPASVHESRDLVSHWLALWNRRELTSIAQLVVTVLVENVLVHTDSAPTLRLEDTGDAVTVGVQDGAHALATRLERADGGGEDVSGLAIVGALCRHWGNAPMSSGKTVWALIGRENEL
ncbi:MAG TPA: ATP-binding protein [Mycobacterium sp.]|nr:ATP-binding protein [Mycobacterium sp.]